VGAFEDLIGANGVIQQLLLYGVANQVVSALASPAFLLLAQDANAAHPEVVLAPDVLAAAVTRNLISAAAGRTEAGKSGTNSTRFNVLLEMAKVRLSPADLATAVLRSYMDAGTAEQVAAVQGVDAATFTTMTDLAGDAPGPQQLADALLRGIIPATGAGPESVSFTQGIAEGRLHNKWAPVLRELSAALLSPPDAANAVVRNFITPEQGIAAAAKSGVDAATFTVMTHLAGDAPGPQQLAEALRRGAIPADGTGAGSTSFLQGIAEGRLADKWAPVIKALSVIWPTPVDAMDARLKGQVTADEGLALYEKLGGDPQFYTWLLNSRGSAPTPLELIEMANRGVIAWDGTGPDAVSYAQGFLEGPWRDKWEGPYRALGEYVPPPSTVTEFLARGAITTADAAAELAKAGMSETMIAAFLQYAQLEALSPYRGLTAGTALDAYKAHIIDAPTLTSILESLHVSAQASALLIEYADMERAFAQIGSAVSRVRSLYAARKIPPETARAALDALGIEPAAAIEMLDAWSVENSISVKVLSEAQIVDAWDIGAMTVDEAMTELANIGYTPFDSWVLLSIKAKAPQDGKPATGPAVPQGAVIPGTT
jgi:hypothetical protein